MGKGDKKTRRGKITSGSYGVLRPRNKPVRATVTKPKKIKTEVTETKTAKPAAKKTTTKKAPTKKAEATK